VKYDNGDRMWSKTAEESNPWLRLMSLIRRDASRQVRRSSFVPATAGSSEALASPPE